MDTFEALPASPRIFPHIQFPEWWPTRAEQQGGGPVNTPGAGASLELAELWRAVTRGLLFMVSSTYEKDCCVAEFEVRAVGLKPIPHVGFLERVLLGESQNSLAIDHGVSCSTIATRCSQALRAMTYEHRASRAPLVLAMAAHAAMGWQLDPATIVRRTAGVRLSLEVVMPDTGLHAGLTDAERRAVRDLLAAKSYAETAGEYNRSVRTIANQLAAAFRKLRVSGRSELMSAVIQRSCRPVALSVNQAH